MTALLTATLVAFVAMFLLAGLYTSVLARSFIVSHVDPALLRDPPNLFSIAAGYLLLAAVMAIVFARVVGGTDAPVKRGLQLGLTFAVMWLMPYSLVLFGAYRFPYEALPLDFAWALVEQGIGGALIGLVYGWFQRTRGGMATPSR